MRFMFTILFTLLCVSIAHSAIKERKYRLPTNITPTRYALDLYINPQQDTFHGYVEITVEVENVTNTVQLHSSPKYLTITNKTVLLDYDAHCNVTGSDEATEIVTITCEKGALKSKHMLTIEFEGRFSVEDMYGLYKSTYKENGKDNVLVSTQFESTYARRMFPCFDEPGFKAAFDVFVVHPDDYTVLANTEMERQLSVGAHMIQTQFKTTPAMSTYLLALVVSKFEARTNDAKENYIYKVYARPSAKDFMGIATTYGSELIDIMSEFTGVPYESLGNKQAYQVAIPDFAAGAMENWGLITYRETDLLDEGNRTSASSKQRIITTVAHELSHQWFGDYVTLDWWSDTWLNEGFATYFEFHNPDLIKNESFELGKQFVIDVIQEVLQKDAMPSSLPLTSPEEEVNTATEDDNKFDDISYSKGGSIIRMIRGMMGDDKFKKGLHLYLDKNQYKNTNPTDLLDALSKTNTNADYDIAEVLENWIYKPGYPLVTASINENGTVVLTQERFTTAENASDETEWHIPISYTTSDEKDFNIRIKHFMKPKSKLEIDINEGSWIILNVQQIGFFRVNYDDNLWDRITTALKDEKQRNDIDVLNRAQLIDDAFNIARVGKIDYERAFDLALYLNSETDYYPWASALSAIEYISGKLGDDEAETLLKKIVLQWINEAFTNTTNENKHIDIIKSSLILDWACNLGQQECVNFALKTFEEYKATRSLPDYNTRGIVFCYALRNSKNPKEDYEFLFDVFKNSTSSTEQNVILSSLGCILDPTVLSTYLSETISEKSSIRKQDAATVFKAVYTNSNNGPGVALKFLEDNLKKIADRYKGMSSLSSIIPGLAGKMATVGDVTRLQKIISDHKDVEEIQIAAPEAFDIITTNLAWTEKYGSKIKSILVDLDDNLANIPKPNYLFCVALSFIVLYLLKF